MSAFDLQAVEAGIAGTEFAGKVRHFPSVGSTNVLAIEAAQAGARRVVFGLPMSRLLGVGAVGMGGTRL